MKEYEIKLVPGEGQPLGGFGLATCSWSPSVCMKRTTAAVKRKVVVTCPRFRERSRKIMFERGTGKLIYLSMT